ncbi:MAG: hypothetical protein ACRENU_15080 [Gemmatimonadaceae bacterium]
MSRSEPRLRVACAAFGVAALIACSGGNDAPLSQSSAGEPDAGLPTAEALQRIAKRRVYFGHQSVGENVLDGLAAILQDHQNAGLRIVKTREPAAVAGPAIMHFDAGRNEYPATKNADFIKVLDARTTRDSGVALLKYCYADVTLDTDIDVLFQDYKRTMGEVKQRHPDLTIVHVTMPLTVDATGPKAAINHLLGRPTIRDLNLKRSRFNSLLRREYGQEPIFDLAMLEATRDDGSQEQAKLRGEVVYSLAPAYSSDGRHLNAGGQRRMADRLVQVLARAAR